MWNKKYSFPQSHIQYLKRAGVLFPTSFLGGKKEEKSRALAHSPFYTPAKITPSQAGEHSGYEPEAPAPDPKLVSLLSTDCMQGRGAAATVGNQTVSGLQFQTRAQTGNLFIFIPSTDCSRESVPKLSFKLIILMSGSAGWWSNKKRINGRFWTVGTFF